MLLLFVFLQGIYVKKNYNVIKNSVINKMTPPLTGEARLQYVLIFKFKHLYSVFTADFTVSAFAYVACQVVFIQPAG